MDESTLGLLLLALMECFRVFFSLGAEFPPRDRPSDLALCEKAAPCPPAVNTECPTPEVTRRGYSKEVPQLKVSPSFVAQPMIQREC